MNLVLGLDAGTHGVRVLALDPVRRSVIASAGRDYPRICAAGVQEMSPEVLWEMCGLALSDVLEKLPAGAKVESLGITHQRGTVIPVDESGKALGPALCDSDSRAATAEELASLGLDAHTYYRRTGCPFVSFNGMAKILWARFYDPALYEKAAAWLSPQDYLITALTGRLTVTEGSASRNGSLSIQDRTLARDLFFGARFLQHDCVPVGESCGTVSPQAFAALDGTRVIAVPGDQPAAVIGSGAAAEGALAMNLGTTFVASLCHTAPVFAEDDMVTVEVLPQGGYTMEFGTGSGGQFMDWIARMLLDGAPADKAFWQTLDARAGDAPAGSDGLRVVPLLWQVTSPGICGAIRNLGAHHTRAHLVRASYEGLACEAAMSIEKVEGCVGTHPDTLRVFGGMSANDGFLEILAAITGKRVVAAEEKQSSALGAALTAALSGGYFETLAQASAAAGGSSRQFMPEKEAYDDGFLQAYRAGR